jgi:hypothetical protein
MTIGRQREVRVRVTEQLRSRPHVDAACNRGRRGVVPRAMQRNVVQSEEKRCLLESLRSQGSVELPQGAIPLHRLWRQPSLGVVEKARYDLLDRRCIEVEGIASLAAVEGFAFGIFPLLSSC